MLKLPTRTHVRGLQSFCFMAFSLPSSSSMRKLLHKPQDRRSIDRSLVISHISPWSYHFSKIFFSTLTAFLPNIGLPAKQCTITMVTPNYTVKMDDLHENQEITRSKETGYHCLSLVRRSWSPSYGISNKGNNFNGKKGFVTATSFCSKSELVFRF